jgi:Co/Zn/Cd efflux system component
VTFKTAAWGPVSVIARQTGSTLSAYPTKHNPLELLYTGTHGADEMFKSEQSKNTIMSWVLRAVGFLAMWIGLLLVLNPMKVLADVIGFIGDIAGAGIALVTFMIALGLPW